MPIPRTYPLGDGLALEVSEHDAEYIKLETRYGLIKRQVGFLVVPRSRLEVRLFGESAEIVIKGGTAGLPIPLYLGPIIAREWNIDRHEYPSYRTAVAAHTAGDVDAEAVTA